MNFKKIPCPDGYIYGVATPLPPSPQLPPGSATATTKRGAALLEVKTIIFLHNLHETDKSLVPSGGNALVLIRADKGWAVKRALRSSFNV